MKELFYKLSRPRQYEPIMIATPHDDNPVECDDDYHFLALCTSVEELPPKNVASYEGGNC